MNTPVVQAIRHVAFEDLGTFERPLREAGYRIEYIEAVEADLASLDPLAADIMIVLGGPIGVNDQIIYRFIWQELDLLRHRLAADRPTLGICLGAQLMAAALGVKVYPGPAKEIGWSRLQLTPAGKAGALAPLGHTPVLHWHGDTFDLPDGCDLLASTELCGHQAFSRGRNVLALQFHAELRASKFDHWLVGHACELGSAAIDPAKLRVDAGRHGESLETAGITLMRDWLSDLRPRPRGVARLDLGRMR